MEPNLSELQNLQTLIEKGNFSLAESKIKSLLEKYKDSEPLQNLLGISLINQKRYNESIEIYKYLIKKQPTNIFAHNNLAVSLMKMKKLDEAILSFEKALSLDPNFNQASINLAEIYVLKNDTNKAEFYLKELVKNNSKTMQILMISAEIFIKIRKIDSAIKIYEMVKKLNPNSFDLSINLGRAYDIKGDYENATDNFLKAIKYNPNSVLAHYNLASTYMHSHNYKASITHFEKSIKLNPRYYQSYANLGLVYKRMLELDKAEIQFKKALEINSDNISSHNNLANIYLDIREYKKAISHYEIALKINPYSPELYGNYLFCLEYIETLNPNFYLEKAKKYTSSIVPIDKESINKYQYDANPKKLRVGFVSSELGFHPNGFFLLNTIRNLKGKNLELYAFSNHERSDEIAKEFKTLFDVWRNIQYQSDLEAINQIRKDGIHILIDCTGHTTNSRLTIFPYKPAPVQISYFGLGSLGIPEIDYFLGSSHLIPKHEENHFVEKIWRLPEVLECFTPPGSNLNITKLPSLKNGYITFGSLNKFSKLSDSALKLWSEVLTSIENSKILIKPLHFKYKGIKEKTIREFEKYKIKSNRIIFTERTEHRDQALELYNSIDICLDAFPFQGNTTTCEAAWMGVPTLTLKGNRFLSHFGEAINTNLGLKEWIAEDQNDFIIKATKFSSDLKQLSELRQGLRDQLLKSPICDAPRLANHFDKMLWEMWKNYNKIN